MFINEYMPLLSLQAPSPPSRVRVSQNGLGGLLVSWTSSVGGANVTGYYIYYLHDGTNHSVTPEANATSATITGLITGVTYSINVVANSTTLPSNVTTASNIILSMYTMAILPKTKCAINILFLQSQPSCPSPPPLPPSWLESLSLSPALSFCLME